MQAWATTITHLQRKKYSTITLIWISNPLSFHLFIFKKCMSYANEKTCPHGVDSKEELSGTMIRKMVNLGKTPEKHLMRPEISDLILKSEKPFVVE